MRFTSLQLFGWGEQKLVKNNQDNQIQNITLGNMYISKKVRYIWCTMGSGTKPPEVGEFLSIFVLKVTLQPVTFLVSYKVTEKNGGAGCITCPSTSHPIPVHMHLTAKELRVIERLCHLYKSLQLQNIAPMQESHSGSLLLEGTRSKQHVNNNLLIEVNIHTKSGLQNF